MYAQTDTTFEKNDDSLAVTVGRPRGSFLLKYKFQHLHINQVTQIIRKCYVKVITGLNYRV